MQHLLPFSQGLSRAAPAPRPGPACQSRQSRWQVVSWHTPPCGQGLSGRMLPPGRLEEPWAPTGLCELNLRRGSAPLEIALQRGVSLGAAFWPPSCGSGLEWLQVLDAGVCEGDSDGRGSRLETEPPGREPGSAGPCCGGVGPGPEPLLPQQFSWVCPGRTSIWLSPSLFIRGVNNPYIVFLLLDYFVFVLKKRFVKIQRND